MGSYLIPGATTVSEAAAYLGNAPPPRQVWAQNPAGIWFSDPNLTDEECAALYADFVPAQDTEDFYDPPIPAPVEAAINTLQGFYNQNPATVTATQTATLLRAVTIILRWLNRQIE